MSVPPRASIGAGVARLSWVVMVILTVSVSVSGYAQASGSKARGSEQTSGAKGKAKAKPARATATVTATTKDKSKPTKTTRASKPVARASGAKSGRSDKAGKSTKPAKVVAAEVKPPPPPTRASGKIAVFLFDGDGGAPLRARVVRLLRARGLKVTTTLRPVDSAEQYREMADTLNLAGFVDGESSEDGDQASVTVHLRSGVSGLRIASATLAGERRALAGEVDKSLWPQLGPPLAKVCVEAAKPRKREREPMRIEAGTPLDTPPANAADPPTADRPL